MVNHLFTPVTLRHKTLKNRVVFGAHTTNMAVNGLPGDRHIAYYVERAMGGAAMIVVEPMPVHAAAVLTRGNFRHSSDDVIAPFRRLTDACHAHDTVMIQQLYHIGAHGDGDNSWHAAWSPSGGPSYHDGDGSHEMSEAEIEQTIDGFVQAARRCQRAGFDGVEVWAAYDGMLDQFWTPFSNQRSDRWGGSLQNRTRMSRDVLRRIRALCGDDFIIGLAVSDEPGVTAHLGREALAEIVALHDRERLMDYVTCGSGSYFDFSRIIPTFQLAENQGRDLAHTLKQAVQYARVTAESHIRTPENAEQTLSAGAADLVSVVRGQIADPFWVAKAAAGNPADIRACLSCNQQCWGRRSRDYWISCLINPSVGHEHQWGGDRFVPVAKARSVLVVGGGPAGLEAARAAAELGHRVTLIEASNQLGGQFRLAGLQPRRAQILDLIDWYQRQLAKLAVDLRFNSYWEADEIAAFGADHVLLATGSLPAGTGFQKALPHVPLLPGIETGTVWSVEDVMGGAARLGQDVVVLDEGGNWRGCGTAWKLAADGHRVVIVTPDALVGKELQRSAADVGLRQTLRGLGVDFATESVITNWDTAGATLRSLLDGGLRQLRADTLVLATVNHADVAIKTALDRRGVGARLIGDAHAPRNAAFAIHDGRKIALSLQSDG
jgi:2,4-dienoyl-CoA reductase-like NADH-dependent reductase (Old Yellow Enzyme family)